MIERATNNTRTDMILIHFGFRLGGQHSPFSQPQLLFSGFVVSMESDLFMFIWYYHAGTGAI
jgi:hypothetical protein